MDPWELLVHRNQLLLVSNDSYCNWGSSSSPTKTQMNHEKKKKKTSFPLYWLANRDPHNGL